MDWLNYHHLLYFWMTAREGSVTAAAKRLRLSPSTVSEQIRTLEDALGQALFDRTGRALKLTEVGRVVQEYADDIFALGQELKDALRDEGPARHAWRFRVGVANNLAKLLAYRLLSPAIHLDDVPVHLVCREDRAGPLVASLAVHHLDLVLADAPVGIADDVRADSVLLGETTVTVCATAALAAPVRVGFPESLDNAPMLLPDAALNLRVALDAWFDTSRIRPRVVAEFGDSALMKSFGQEGAGLFPVPTLVAAEVCRQYGVEAVGELSDVHERIYAIVMPRRRRNPVVRAIIERASQVLDPPA